jgi:hypothetical protein
MRAPASALPGAIDAASARNQTPVLIQRREPETATEDHAQAS